MSHSDYIFSRAVPDHYVFCVHFSNHLPMEIDSIWSNKDDALIRANELNSGDEDRWDVTERVVCRSLPLMERQN